MTSSQRPPSRKKAAGAIPSGPATAPVLPPEVRPGQSVRLLQELHILTRDGKLNQDSRRKLKQVYHLYQFIEKLMHDLALPQGQPMSLADHGAGKSYLGFILYDLYFKHLPHSHLYGIETRAELVQKSQALAQELGFARMSFLHSSVAESTQSQALPATVDVVTALHACDTATDDAIAFALHKRARLGVGSVLPGRGGAAFGRRQSPVLGPYPIGRAVAPSAAHPGAG